MLHSFPLCDMCFGRSSISWCLATRAAPSKQRRLGLEVFTRIVPKGDRTFGPLWVGSASQKSISRVSKPKPRSKITLSSLIVWLHGCSPHPSTGPRPENGQVVGRICKRCAPETRVLFVMVSVYVGDETFVYNLILEDNFCVIVSKQFFAGGPGSCLPMLHLLIPLLSF